MKYKTNCLPNRRSGRLFLTPDFLTPNSRLFLTAKYGKCDNEIKIGIHEAKIVFSGAYHIIYQLKRSKWIEHRSIVYTGTVWSASTHFIQGILDYSSMPILNCKVWLWLMETFHMRTFWDMETFLQLCFTVNPESLTSKIICTKLLLCQHNNRKRTKK